MKQLTLNDLFADRKAEEPCRHQEVCVTRRYVPTGLACMQCGLLLYQYIPQPPDERGRMSADWEWHHIDGRAWTTQD